MHINARWLRQKRERQRLAASRVGSATYSIHDRRYVFELLRHQHLVARAVAKKLGQLPPSKTDLDSAMRRNTRRYLQFIGMAGKYRPHQGAKECARRANAS